MLSNFSQYIFILCCGEGFVMDIIYPKRLLQTSALNPTDLRHHSWWRHGLRSQSMGKFSRKPGTPNHHQGWHMNRSPPCSRTTSTLHPSFPTTPKGLISKIYEDGYDTNTFPSRVAQNPLPAWALSRDFPNRQNWGCNHHNCHQGAYAKARVLLSSYQIKYIKEFSAIALRWSPHHKIA